ncbi:MAG: phosphatidate cytidylyltransferase [Clostridia bacterium]|nr:phosphatidate cytidylyltransferase [Clostridia bacterium]
MKKRVITSAAILLAMLLLVIFSNFIVYPVAVSVVAVIAVFEMLRALGAHKELLLSAPAYLLTPAFPIAAFFVKSENFMKLLLALAACFFVYIFWLMAVCVFSKGRIAFSKVGEIFAAVTYVSVSFTSLTLVRYIDREYGIFFVFLAFMLPWTCDVSAYVVGSLFGKHKLIPEVSPKKTVEGAIGGILFSALFCFVYGLAIDLLLESVRVNYLVLILLGVILSVVAQLGDLIASVIKREHGIKDYGRLFPGHGGVMDRFDSVLAISTIMLIVCIIFPPFTSI